MNLLIVESKKPEIRKLTRILHLMDPSIKVMKVVNDVDAVWLWLQSNPTPDLVLIEHSQLTIINIQHQLIQAKLVLHTKQYNFTYLAFRTYALHQLLLINGFKAAPVSTAPTQEIPEPIILSSPLTPSFPGIPVAFKNRFFVGHGKRFLSVSVEDIAYFFSDGRFVYFITFKKNKYVVQHRMDELQQLLNPEQFYRINRSYIISIKSIEQINPYYGGRFKLKLTPPVLEEIIVSKNRAAGFKIWLGE